MQHISPLTQEPPSFLFFDNRASAVNLALLIKITLGLQPNGCSACENNDGDQACSKDGGLNILTN